MHQARTAAATPQRRQYILHRRDWSDWQKRAAFRIVAVRGMDRDVNTPTIAEFHRQGKPQNKKNPQHGSCCGFVYAFRVSGNLNGNGVAGVAKLPIRSHVQNVGFETGQFGLAVMSVGANDQPVADAGLVRGSAVDGDNS